MSATYPHPHPEHTQTHTHTVHMGNVNTDDKLTSHTAPRGGTHFSSLSVSVLVDKMEPICNSAISVTLPNKHLGLSDYSITPEQRNRLHATHCTVCVCVFSDPTCRERAVLAGTFATRPCSFLFLNLRKYSWIRKVA